MNAGRRRGALRLACLCAALTAVSALGAAEEWRPGRTIHGVPLEWRKTASPYDAFRGTVRVCATPLTLNEFAADAERFTEWIPFTEAAHTISDSGIKRVYYVRTSTPWPLKSRDMIYELELLDGAPGEVRLAIHGRPDALPRRDDAVRVRSAEGMWIMRPEGDAMTVTLWMTTDPGRFPALFVNRRVAATVAGTLAHLRERFACP